MKVKTWHCAAGKCIAVNPYPKYIDETIDHFPLREWSEFEAFRNNPASPDIIC